MALYMKQDFTPPVLSRRWLAMKFRPNMILYSHQHVISVLESGLLFREDSVEVEQDSPPPEEIWKVAGVGKSGWMTRGEKIMSLCAVGTCVAAFPPRSIERSTLMYLAAYIALPVAIRACHRHAARGSLVELLANMRDYLALARRAAACLKECTALRSELGSVSSVLESTHTMLCRQQNELAIVMSRASSALLGNAPWLRSDVAWDAVTNDSGDNLLKIHHAFLVVQSTLLKHIAMAHYIQSTRAQKIYKNHNERIYWIHSVLIPHLNCDFKENYDSLERMYRLLKNYGNNDASFNKKPGTAINDSWLYSDVHSGIARASLELKSALNKCNNLDMFLDSCALNKQEIDLNILNSDLDSLIDGITKCLTTAQSSQIRLKKLQHKFDYTEHDKVQDEDELVNETDKLILRIEDRVPETKDEVFYFVKTEDDDNNVEPIGDVSIGPGKKEKETTKIVLNELKRKLVRREDVMRERERQALARTMPKLKDNVPEFPRQIKIEEVVERKGYISKINRKVTKRKLFRHYKINTRTNYNMKHKLQTKFYTTEKDINDDFYEANAKINVKSKLLTFSKDKRHYVKITRWIKQVQKPKDSKDFSDLSEGLSDVEASTANKTVNQASNVSSGYRNGEKNYKFTKKDLELSPSSSESDEEFYKQERVECLKDRRHRAIRRKNYPDRRGSAPDKAADEGLRPIEYSFGAGLAMAAVLQSVTDRRVGLASEELFVGDGQVSGDSGNDEDA